MRKAGSLAPQAWMRSPELHNVMAALAADGKAARFVGGCVRDALLDRPVSDVDIATPEPPERVVKLLKAAGIRAVPTGIDHGTITAVASGAHFEITTLRHDVETFGRHAKVAFTDDWEADAARRDFTMNAMFCDPDGTLYDPTGGIADLKAGKIRFVGDPGARLDEDVLRLLRFFRFHAWYGAGAPDDEALAACRARAVKLPGLSAERVWSELRRTLLAPDPGAVFRLMAENEILAHAVAEAKMSDRLAALATLEVRLALAPDSTRRLAALVEDTSDAESLAGRLRLSRYEKHRLAAILGGRGELTANSGIKAQRQAIYRLGAELYDDLVLIGWAGAAEDEGWPALWQTARSWTAPEFPVRGADVVALGIPKGARVGKLLAAVESWWMEQDFAPDREACLARLKELSG